MVITILTVDKRAEVATTEFYRNDMCNNILKLRTTLCKYLNVEKVSFCPSANH
jgi:hypothetical protein